MSVLITETERFPKSANHGGGSTGISEIEEENVSELFEINHDGEPMASIKEEFESSLFSFDINENSGDVYVAVGKGESSMDAVLWTLKHIVNSSRTTLVYLLHIFPELRHIPTPLGNLPKSQVSPEQVENYMIQERSKRADLLRKFLDMCSASKVKADTMLIESDIVANAILDLIPILNIRKLVLGTSKSSLRKSKSKRRSGIADQILQKAPEFCDVMIICEGKQVFDKIIDLPSPHDNAHDSKISQEEQRVVPFTCGCFK